MERGTHDSPRPEPSPRPRAHPQARRCARRGRVRHSSAAVSPWAGWSPGRPPSAALVSRSAAQGLLARTPRATTTERSSPVTGAQYPPDYHPCNTDRNSDRSRCALNTAAPHTLHAHARAGSPVNPREVSGGGYASIPQGVNGENHHQTHLGSTPGARAITAEVARWREWGVKLNPEELMERERLGLAAMMANLREYAVKHGLGPGFAVTELPKGGVPVTPPDDGLTERDRVRIAAFDSLMAERGLSLAG